MVRRELRSKDIPKLLEAVPGLVMLRPRGMWLDYDAEADVLYLSFARPQHALDSEMREDGMIIHKRGKQIVGLTILEASTR